MSVTVGINDKGQSAPLSTLTSTMAWIGVSSAGGAPGTQAAVYRFNAPGLVNPNIGYGPGPEGVAAGVRVSQTQQIYVRIAATIPGTLSTVAQTGSGPLPALSGTPYDSAASKLQIFRAGPLGTSQFQFAADGGTFGPVTDIPAPVAAGVTGTGDLSALTYSTLNTLTLLLTPANGSPETVTFTGTTALNFLTQINAIIGPATIMGTVDLTSFTWTSLGTQTLNLTTGDGTLIPVTFATPANGAAAMTTMNTALGVHGAASLVTIGGTLVLRVTDALTNATSTLTVRAGTANAALGLVAGPVTYRGAQASIVQGKYLLITDGTTGQASTLTIGAGTANTILGLTAGATTGAASTYVIPFTGITITFPVGTYVLSEIYSWSSTEPRFTPNDLATAITVLQQSGVYFRDIVLLNSPIDGADTRAFAAQAAVSLTTLRGALPRVFSMLLMNSSIGLPSAIAANDADVKAAMQGQTDSYVCVAHGDCYMQGTATSGSFRRPLVFSLGIREASYPISSDPGNREQPSLEETAMVAPDLTTLARNEDICTVAMQASGFTVARNELGFGYFCQGLTRSSSPKFLYLPIMRTAVEAARILYINAKRYENASRFANPDGTIRESDAVAIETFINETVLESLDNDISGSQTTVDRTGVVTITNTLGINVDIQPKAYFYKVKVNLGLVDIFT